MQIGHYTIESEIARGGMGVVYRAVDAQLDRRVAIKVLQRASEKSLQRFRREGELLAALRHPNVVAIHAAGESDGCPYLVMDLVEGDSLAEQLHREGPFEPWVAISLCLAISNALETVHAHGVLHRDIKPANVLLSVSGEPLLTDFGLAKSSDAPTDLTRTGVFLGTPGFAAPEQAFGRKQEIGPMTDIFGLGATLFALLTGAPPYRGETLSELMVALQAAPDPPSAFRPELGPEIDALCLRCLAPNPKDRFPSAAALSAELTRLMVEGADGSEPAGRPSLAILAGSAAVVALAGGLWGATTWARAPGPTPPSTSPGTDERGDSGTLVKVRAHLQLGQHSQALDLLDGLDAPPADLVWGALMPVVRARVKEELPAVALELLARPAPARLVAAGDRTALAERQAVAERAGSHCGSRPAFQDQAAQLAALETDVLYLRLARLLSPDFRLSPDLALSLVSGATFFLRTKALGPLHVDRALEIARIMQDHVEVQQRVASFSRVVFRGAAVRFVPVIRRAIELSASDPDALRQLHYDLSLSLFSADLGTPEAGDLAKTLLADPQLTPDLREQLRSLYVDHLARCKRYEEALKALEPGLEYARNRLAWRAQRATLLWLLGRRDESLSTAWALAEAPITEQERFGKFGVGAENLGIPRYVARAHACEVLWQGAKSAETQRVRDAVVQLLELLDEHPRTSSVQVNCALKLAWLELELARPQAAQAALAQAVAHLVKSFDVERVRLREMCRQQSDSLGDGDGTRVQEFLISIIERRSPIEATLRGWLPRPLPPK